MPITRSRTRTRTIRAHPSSFYTIRVNTRTFLNAYYNLILHGKNQTDMRFIKNNPDYFSDDPNAHDDFITKLFNNSLFPSTNGVLTNYPNECNEG